MLEPDQGRPSPCGSVRNPLRELHQLGSLQIGLVVFAELRGSEPGSLSLRRPHNLRHRRRRCPGQRSVAGNG